MLIWSVVFLVVAMISAVFGFTGSSVGAAGVAKALFFMFLALFVVSFVAGVLLDRRRGP